MQAELLARASGHLDPRPEAAFAVRGLKCQRTVAEVLSQTGFTSRSSSGGRLV
jgi:hypothetical protein